MRKKRLFLIIVIIILILSFNIISYASNSTSGGNLIINPDDYKPASSDSASNANLLRDIGNDIIGFLQIAGSILSVIVLIILGIKYMMGSADERAEYKKSMGPYVLGAVLVFAITNILGIISNIAGDLF